MISVTILTKNSEKYLQEVLESVEGFDEVLLYDNGSTDRTLEIARTFPNVAVKEGPFEGFGKAHNSASALAKNDWILSLDSDEVVTEEMTARIRSLSLDPGCVYAFPRQNYFNGKWIRWCGWHPDRQYRLYNRKKTRFTDAEVHEQIIVRDMKYISLKEPIRHYSYASHSDFLKKMQLYSDLFAKQNCGKKRSSPFKAAWRAAAAFLKSYLLKRGFLGGYEGFVISVYNANCAFYKYLKLYEANRERGGAPKRRRAR